MSASTAQIDANRANAQLSTGPTTLEGKAVSSQNAVRHGFLAHVLPAEQDDYRALLDDLIVDLQPAGTIQRLLVEEITLAYIRLRRIHQAEMKRMEPRDVTSEGWSHDRGKFIDIERMPGTNPYDLMRDKQSQLVLRYEASVERHIQRCLTRLKEMKGDPTWKAVRRAANQARSEQPNDSEIQTVAEMLAESREARKHEEQRLNATIAALPSPPKREIGFVSQNNDSPTAKRQNGFVSQNNNHRSPGAARRRNRSRNRHRPGR